MIVMACCLVAVQLHALPVVTVNCRLPPPLPIEALAGDTVKVHEDGVRNVSVAE